MADATTIEKPATERGTGRTTAMLYRAMAEACTPGRRVMVVMHTHVEAVRASRFVASHAAFVENAAQLHVDFKNGARIEFAGVEYAKTLNRVSFWDHAIGRR